VWSGVWVESTNSSPITRHYTEWLLHLFVKLKQIYPCNALKMEAEIYSETPVTRYQSTRHHNLISTAATVTWYRSTSVWKKTYLKWLNTNKQTNKQTTQRSVCSMPEDSITLSVDDGWVSDGIPFCSTSQSVRTPKTSPGALD